MLQLNLQLRLRWTIVRCSSHRVRFNNNTCRSTDARHLLASANASLDAYEPFAPAARSPATSSDESPLLKDGALDRSSITSTAAAVEAAAAAHGVVRASYEVLRLDVAGAVRRLRIRRRDLLREHGLQPRDLRRIDPAVDVAKAAPSVTIKDGCLLLSLGGARAIVTADRALLFEPAASTTRKLLDTLVPRLQASAGQRLLARPGRDDSVTLASEAARPPPFELEVLEGVLTVATGRLDAEVLAVTRRVGELLRRLPRDITPVNLEELRRIKQALVELEGRADTLRAMLEAIMDDEDELRELNLSSRPRREERRKARERERMQRQLTRAREEMEEQAARRQGTGGGGSGQAGTAGASTDRAAAPTVSVQNGLVLPARQQRQDALDSSASSSDPAAEFADARDALAELAEAEEEARELEEVEDLLEYYLQRASATQSEAERLLEGARDLEESIGVSLSARRYEVNRLELMLSMGSFAAAIGAVVAGIFGMNLRSTLEPSVAGFWAITIAILLGCLAVFAAIMRYTQRKRIL